MYVLEKRSWNFVDTGVCWLEIACDNNDWAKSSITAARQQTIFMFFELFTLTPRMLSICSCWQTVLHAWKMCSLSPLRWNSIVHFALWIRLYIFGMNAEFYLFSVCAIRIRRATIMGFGDKHMFNDKVFRWRNHIS